MIASEIAFTWVLSCEIVLSRAAAETATVFCVGTVTAEEEEEEKVVVVGVDSFVGDIVKLT